MRLVLIRSCHTEYLLEIQSENETTGMSVDTYYLSLAPMLAQF